MLRMRVASVYSLLRLFVEGKRRRLIMRRKAEQRVEIGASIRAQSGQTRKQGLEDN